MEKRTKIGLIIGGVVFVGIIGYALLHSKKANAANTKSTDTDTSGDTNKSGVGSATKTSNGATAVTNSSGKVLGTATTCGTATVVCVNGKQTKINATPDAINRLYKITGIRI